MTKNGMTQRGALSPAMHLETGGTREAAMRPHRASRGIRSMLAALLSCALAAGCGASRNVTVSDLRHHGPSSVRVILDGGEILELNRYVVTQDRLAGVGRVSHRFGERPFAGSVPLARVLAVEPLGMSAAPLVITLCVSAVVFGLLVVPPD